MQRRGENIETGSLRPGWRTLDLEGKKGWVLSLHSTPDWIFVAQRSAEILQNLGAVIEYVKIGHLSFPKISSPAIPGVRQHKLNSSRHRPPSSYLEQDLESEFHSMFRDSRPKGFIYALVRKLANMRLKKFQKIFFEELQENRIDFVVIPNGRVGITKVAAKACKELEVEVIFTETKTGFHAGEKNFFMESFSPWDRQSRQKQLQQGVIDQETDKNEFENWLNNRVRRSHESFKPNISKEIEVVGKENQEDGWNLFLTSSSDEFWGAGPEWDLDDWQDQYEAIEKTVDFLKSTGETNFILRLHPNATTKSLSQTVAEWSKVINLRQSHPELQIVNPLSAQNTYDLISDSKRVFVTLSTAGLEACGLGIPVWCFKPTYYDEMADVRTLWRPSDLTTQHLEVFLPDKRGACDFFWAIQREGSEYVEKKPSWNQKKSTYWCSIVNSDLPIRLALSVKRGFGAYRSTRFFRSRLGFFC